MATLSASAIGELLQPYLVGKEPENFAPDLFERLAIFLDLLLKWNATENLTSVRTPEDIVRRHFGESLFLALHLDDLGEMLDFGSGAGFPGIPVQLALPALKVTLAESQTRKASFLREAIRSLGLTTAIWSRRVEELPIVTQFDVVVLRAVDKMELALAEAARRSRHDLFVIGNAATGKMIADATCEIALAPPTPIPRSNTGFLWHAKRIAGAPSPEP